ncbi:MAG: hypothetical protein ACI4OT_05435 [Bacilli bacterium]
MNISFKNFEHEKEFIRANLNPLIQTKLKKKKQEAITYLLTADEELKQIVGPYFTETGFAYSLLLEHEVLSEQAKTLVNVIIAIYNDNQDTSFSKVFSPLSPSSLELALNAIHIYYTPQDEKNLYQSTNTNIYIN